MEAGANGLKLNMSMKIVLQENESVLIQRNAGMDLTVWERMQNQEPALVSNISYFLDAIASLDFG